MGEADTLYFESHAEAQALADRVSCAFAARANSAGHSHQWIVLVYANGGTWTMVSEDRMTLLADW